MWFGRTTTQQFRGPTSMTSRQAGVQRLPEPLRVQLEEQRGRRHQALSNKGLFQSLAEPNLIAENGKEASFLAGGEYPYPVVQGRRRDRVTISSRSTASG